MKHRELSVKRPPLFNFVFFLMPTGDHKGKIIEADAQWRFDEQAVRNVDLVAWGRVPLRSVIPIRSALRHAVTRELAIRRIRRRPPSCFRVRGTHRIHPSADPRGMVAAWLRHILLDGAAVELVKMEPITRKLDAVAVAAGADNGLDSLHTSGDGSALARFIGPQGNRLILRLAPFGHIGDPTRHREALQALATMPEIPRLKAWGHTADLSWSVETVLPGRRPRRITSRLFADIGDFYAKLSLSSGPPEAPLHNMRMLRAVLLSRSSAILQIGDFLASHLAGLPAQFGHGDLWAGNILASSGRLTGIIDWSSSYHSAVAGADLVNLFVTEARVRRGYGEMGDAWKEKAWRDPTFYRATSDYWHRVGIRPNEATLDAIAISSWFNWTANAIYRHPNRAINEPWISRNFDQVVKSLGWDALQP